MGSNEGEVLVLTQSVRVLVLLEELGQTLQVGAVETLDVLRTGTGVLGHRDGLSNWNRTRKSSESEPKSCFYRVLTCSTSQRDGFFRTWGRTDGVDGLPVGHQTKAVLENSSGVEQREGDSHDALQAVLWGQNTSRNVYTGPNLRFWF